MELRCPDCCSPEIGLRPGDVPEEMRCENCGETFDRRSAYVTVADAEDARPTVEAPFGFDRLRGAAVLADVDADLVSLSESSDADEVNRALEDAQEADVITSSGTGFRIYAYPLSISEASPVLALALPASAALLGPELKLLQDDGESDDDFTLRVLEGAVGEANGLAAARAADSIRLDRIADFLNRPGQWNGGDVCEFVADETAASGRRILDADE